MEETDELPRAVWSGEFEIFGVRLRAHVLDNGQRVIDEDSICDLLEAMGDVGVTCERAEEEVRKFALWMRGATT